MVDFSNDDWLIGLSTMGIVILGYIIGLFFLYQSRKLRIRLLTIYSISFIFATTAWLPIVIDFISVLLTESSINKYLYVYLMWIPAPIAGILIFYIASEFLAPKNKWFIFAPFLVYQGFTTLGTILNPLGVVIFIEPPLTGFIHKAGLDPAGLSSFVGLIGFLIILVFAGLGYLRKAFKSEGIIRKKFIFLSISVIFVVGFGMLDSLTWGIALVLVRIGAMSNFIFAYLGLREEPEKIKIKPTEKEIKIEDSLFRIRKRPAEITEAEITYYKEQKICLVCKGKVGGFNTYICTGCDVLYCEKCARALTNAENVCWVCEEPIDKSKPVKPILVEGTEEGEKRPDTKTSELEK
ncbi:MAG: PHD finger domain-containing protein [Promethearchaeota archaeon]